MHAESTFCFSIARLTFPCLFAFPFTEEEEEEVEVEEVEDEDEDDDSLSCANAVSVTSRVVAATAANNFWKFFINEREEEMECFEHSDEREGEPDVPQGLEIDNRFKSSVDQALHIEWHLFVLWIVHKGILHYLRIDLIPVCTGLEDDE